MLTAMAKTRSKNSSSEEETRPGSLGSRGRMVTRRNRGGTVMWVLSREVRRSRPERPDYQTDSAPSDAGPASAAAASPIRNLVPRYYDPTFNATRIFRYTNTTHDLVCVQDHGRSESGLADAHTSAHCQTAPGGDITRYRADDDELRSAQATSRLRCTIPMECCCRSAGAPSLTKAPATTTALTTSGAWGSISISRDAGRSR